MRNRMISQNLAKSTIEGYVYGARQLALYCRQSFEEIETEQVYAFLCHLKEERGLSRQTMRIAVSGIKYLYTHLLSREDVIRHVPYPKQEKYLPEILTGEEIRRLFDKTTNLKHRAFLKTVYSAGLRRSEACSLLVSDVDLKAGHHLASPISRQCSAEPTYLLWLLSQQPVEQGMYCLNCRKTLLK